MTQDTVQLIGNLWLDLNQEVNQGAIHKYNLKESDDQFIFQRLVLASILSCHSRMLKSITDITL